MDNGALAKGAAQPDTKRGTTRRNDVTASPTLTEIGITKRQLADWQNIAAIEEAVFEAALQGEDTAFYDTLTIIRHGVKLDLPH